MPNNVKLEGAGSVVVNTATKEQGIKTVQHLEMDRTVADEIQYTVRVCLNLQYGCSRMFLGHFPYASTCNAKHLFQLDRVLVKPHLEYCAVFICLSNRFS